MNIKGMIAAALLMPVVCDSHAQEVTTEGKKAYCNGNVIAVMKTPMRRTGFSIKAYKQAVKDANTGNVRPDYQDGTCYIEDSAGRRVMGFGMYGTQGRYLSAGTGGFVVFRFDDPELDFTLPAAHIAKYEFYTKKIKIGYDVSGIAPEVLLTFAAMKHLIKTDGTLDTVTVRSTGSLADRLPMLNQQQVDAHGAKNADCAGRWRPSAIVFPLRFEQEKADTFAVHEITSRYYKVYDSSRLVGSVVVTGSWEAWAIPDGEYNRKRIAAIEEVKVEPLKYYFTNTEGCIMAEYRAGMVYNLRGGAPTGLKYYIDAEKETYTDRAAFLQALTSQLVKKSFIF
jgi:hypothetical protein